MTADSTSDRRSLAADPSQPMRWNAPPCRVRIITEKDETWLDLARPFALIGSHRCCDVQIGGSSSIPPVAYFVCCLANSVEVWPTSAIAFPRWGAIRPDVELLVGHSRVTVHHPRVSENEHSPLPFLASDVVEAKMTWLGKTITKTFRRPVTLIGENHPSVLRLHGRGLKRCHYAAVVAEQSLWIINIARNDLPPEARIQRLSEPGDRTQIGDVVVELSSVTPIPQPKRSPDLNAFASKTTDAKSGVTDAKNRSATTSLLAERREPSGEAPEGLRPSATTEINEQPVSDVSDPAPRISKPTSKMTARARNNITTANSEVEPVAKTSRSKSSGKAAKQGVKRPASSRQPGKKKKLASEVEKRNTSTSSTSSTSAASGHPVKRPEESEQLPGADDREALASNVTDRMVSMMHSRSSKKRMIMLAAMTLGFLVAGLVLFVFLRKILSDWF